MDAAYLTHDTTRALIICTLHGFALVPSGIESHLRNKHHCKGETLHTAKEYIKTVSSTLQSPTSIAQPAHYSTPIPHLTKHHGFACNVPECAQQRDWLSQSRRAVERHVCREHDVPDGRSKAGRAHVDNERRPITPIRFQTIFPRPHFHAFIVDDPERERRSDGDAVTAKEAGEQDVAQVEAWWAPYKMSKEQEQASLHAVGGKPDKSQLPPWLRQTGISNFIVDVDRGDVYAVLSAARSAQENHLSTVVFDLLPATGEGVQLGTMNSRLTRIAARALNSFEAHRTQSRPFCPVQETSRLRRYAGYWTTILVYLLRMESPEWQERFSRRHYALRDDMQARVEDVAQQLQAHTQAEDDERTRSPSGPLELSSCAQAVLRLSCSLTRFQTSKSAFESPVVRGCALATVEENGAWAQAVHVGPCSAA